MRTPLLIDVPKTSLTRRERIKAFKAKHEIETSYCRGIQCPWAAAHLPTARKLGAGYGLNEKSNLGECLARVCRLMEESGCMVCEDTEIKAIKQLCRYVNIPCDL
jgi:hypothetical protein